VLAHSRSSAVRIAHVNAAVSLLHAPQKTVQNEAVTLTRDIPTGLGWLIEPFITNIPKETLEFTLQALRKAVLNNSH
jgi:hypothetical protein